MDFIIELGPLLLPPKTKQKKNKKVKRGNLICPTLEMECLAKIEYFELCQTPMSERLVEAVDG